MQSIETTYRGPTDAHGSRIVARAQAGRVVVPYEHGGAPWGGSTDGAHDLAFLAFVARWEWWGTWIRAGKADGRGNVYACAERLHEGKGPDSLKMAAQGWDSLAVYPVSTEQVGVAVRRTFSDGSEGVEVHLVPVPSSTGKRAKRFGGPHGR